MSTKNKLQLNVSALIKTRLFYFDNDNETTIYIHLNDELPK
jgi:hypothetical protein